jgi:hypothetical protein
LTGQQPALIRQVDGAIAIEPAATQRTALSLRDFAHLISPPGCFILCDDETLAKTSAASRLRHSEGQAVATVGEAGQGSARPAGGIARRGNCLDGDAERLACETSIANGMTYLSSATWSLTPRIFLPPSIPRSNQLGAERQDRLSITTARGWFSLQRGEGRRSWGSEGGALRAGLAVHAGSRPRLHDGREAFMASPLISGPALSESGRNALSADMMAESFL